MKTSIKTGYVTFMMRERAPEILDTYEDAMSTTENPQWRCAIREIKALKKNNT